MYKYNHYKGHNFVCLQKIVPVATTVTLGFGLTVGITPAFADFNGFS